MSAWPQSQTCRGHTDRQDPPMTPSRSPGVPVPVPGPSPPSLIHPHIFSIPPTIQRVWRSTHTSNLLPPFRVHALGTEAHPSDRELRTERGGIPVRISTHPRRVVYVLGSTRYVLVYPWPRSTCVGETCLRGEGRRVRERGDEGTGVRGRGSVYSKVR